MEATAILASLDQGGGGGGGEKWSDSGSVLKVEPTGQRAAKQGSQVGGLGIWEHGGAICQNRQNPVKGK